MKISRNELRRMILESLLREQEGGPDLTDRDRRREKRKDKKAARKNKKEKTAELAPPPSPAPAAKAAPAPAAAAKAAPAPAAKAAKKKIPNPKIKYIQKIIKDPSSNEGQNDGSGIWTTGQTDVSWRKWLSDPETIEKFEKFVKEKNIQLTERFFRNWNFLLKEQDENNEELGTSDTSETPVEKFLRDNAGSAATIAKKMGFSADVGGVFSLLKELEEIKNSEESQDTASSDDLDDSDESNESDSSNEIDSVNAARFRAVKALADKSIVGGEDMRRIHSRIYEIWKTGLFNKIKSKSDDGIRNDLSIALEKVFGNKNESIKFLRYFGTGGASGGEKISFPLARGPMTKNMKGSNPETESFSVLVDDVKKMLEGGDPEYKIGGSDQFVNESQQRFGKSHATLIRERYWGRY